MGSNSIDSRFGLDKTHLKENSNQQLILIWAGYARHGYGGQLEGELRHSMTSQAPNMLGMRSSTGVFLVNLFILGLLLNI